MDNKPKREQKLSGGSKQVDPADDDSVLDESSMESFPASDPPAWTPTKTGKPKK